MFTTVVSLGSTHIHLHLQCGGGGGDGGGGWCLHLLLCCEGRAGSLKWTSARKSLNAAIFILLSGSDITDNQIDKLKSSICPRVVSDAGSQWCYDILTNIHHWYRSTTTTDTSPSIDVLTFDPSLDRQGKSSTTDHPALSPWNYL